MKYSELGTEVTEMQKNIYRLIKIFSVQPDIIHTLQNVIPPKGMRVIMYGCLDIYNICISFNITVD